MNGELQPWRPAGTPWRPPGNGEGADRFFQATVLHAQLHRYLEALRRRWWVMVVSLVVIGGPALWYAWHTPPSYQSQASMWYRKLNRPDRQYEEDIASYIATQAQLLKSPRVMAPALEQVRSQFPALNLGPPPGATAVSPFELSVRTQQRSTTLELKAVGPEPEATRAFLNAAMKAYQDFRKQSWVEGSSTVTSPLEAQMQELQEQIQAQRRRLALFEASNNVPNQVEKARNAGARLATLSGDLAVKEVERQLLEKLTPAEFLKIREVPPNLVLEQMRLQAKQQIQTCLAQSNTFAKDLRPTHSKMVKLSQQVASAELWLKHLEQEDFRQAQEKMSNRKTALELEIQNLKSQYRAWETNSAEASQIVAEDEQRKREVERLQTQCDRMADQLVQVKLQKSLGEEGGLEVLALAAPAHPTAARQGIAAAGLFLALLVGVGAFLFLGFLDDRFTSAMELSLHLPTEVVGQIPRSHLTLPNGASHLLPLTTAQPAFAESFRNLRSSLLFMSGQAVPPKVVLITSAIPKEGKTTVASNLAGILAMSGARVLLVDADFRRGYIHRIFHVPRKPGLLEVLSEDVPLAQAIMPTEQHNLFVLPAGETGDYTSDVLLRYRVDRVLQTLATGYDHVIVDSAPVLATDDAACIGPHTDGAYLVVRAEYTASRMTQEAWGRLTRRNVKVLGVIYNCAPASGDYYSHYSREYGTPRSNGFVEASEVSGNGSGDPAGQR